MPARNTKKRGAMVERRRRTAQLWRELAKGTPGELIGVVRPRGVGGGKSQGEKQWTLQIELMAWRFEDGPVRRGKLEVRKRVGERVVALLMERIGDYAIVRMRARLAEENVTGSPQALMVKYLGEVDDAPRELLKVAGGLKKPVVIKDRRLGVLKLDPGSGDFEGKAEWVKGRVRVTLRADGKGKNGGVERSLATACGLFGGKKDWHRRVMNRVLGPGGAYEEWNRVWRQEGDRPLSEERFASKLKLRVIETQPDGGFSFWFDDGDLFGGHSVVVSGSISRGGVKDVSLEG